MSALVLTARALPRQRLDLSPLTPERLRGLDTAAIGRLELPSGNARIPVAELFSIAGGSPEEIVIRGATAGCDFIGRDMRAGSVTVEGDAGVCCGQDMRGGALRVTGNVGPWAGSAMTGGRLEIGGDAGESLGGPVPGGMRGIGGGIVLVRGRAGDRAADRMRRGIVVVEGDAGDYAGSRMIAGTLLVLGSIGDYPGFAMKRGTLMLREMPRRFLPSFTDCGAHELGFVRLLAGILGDDGAAAGIRSLGVRLRRHLGDSAVDGKGEVLVWQP